MSVKDAINAIYQEELGGNADAGGLAFYTGLAEAGVPLSEIQAQINASPEGQAYDASGQAGFGRETISYAGEPSAYDVAVSSGKLKTYTPPAIKGTAAEQSLQNNYNAVLDAYQREYGRPPSGNELIDIGNRLAGGESATNLISQIASSPEAQIFDVYGSQLGRDPRLYGDIGIDYYLNQIGAGQRTLEETLAQIQDSPEAILRGVYFSELGRDPREGGDRGIDEYLRLIEGGGKTLDQVIADIQNSPEAQAYRAQQAKIAASAPTGPYGGTSQYGSQPGLAPIAAPLSFLPAGGRTTLATTPYDAGSTLQGPLGLFRPTTTGAAPTVPVPVPVPVPVAEAPAEGMKEGGVAKMAKFTPEELGSKFNISEFIDEEGRLISGYSRPIRDEFGTILGYEDRPYERDVVFNPILARRQEEEKRRLETMNMARGGLADIADEMSSMGRGEDTMLLHVSPEEVRGLDAVARNMMGTGLTINPYTGLPEADIFNKIGKVLKKVAKPIAKVAPFILPFTPLGPLAQGLISGLSTGLASGDAKKGLFAGITSYGTANLAQGAQAAGAEAAAQAGADAAVKAGADAAAQAGAQAGLGSLSADAISAAGLKGGADYGALQGSFLDRAGSAVADSFSKGLDISGIPGRVADTVRGVGNLAFSDAAGRQAAAEAAKAGMDVSPTTAATATFLGASGEAARDVELAAKRENAAILSDEREKERRYRELAQRLQQQYPFEFAKGGLTSLAGGGMTYMEAGGTTGPTGTPREVVGNGDGMSDSVPADIEGVQEARLADGEFVIPADVVADIGNGSSDAGSKKLYDMMDRIRMARHGTKEQPPEINAERLMPA